MGPSKMDIAEAVGAIKKMDASMDASRMASGGGVSETTQQIFSFLKIGAFALTMIIGGVTTPILFGFVGIYACFSIGFSENEPLLIGLGIFGIIVVLVILILAITLIKKLIKKKKR